MGGLLRPAHLELPREAPPTVEALPERRRTPTATSTGTWGTSYLANDDYSVYATNGTAQSASVPIQVAPAITGPATRTVLKNSTNTITGTGTGIPGTTVTVRFHKAGTAATDYRALR